MTGRPAGSFDRLTALRLISQAIIRLYSTPGDYGHIAVTEVREEDRAAFPAAHITIEYHAPLRLSPKPGALDDELVRRYEITVQDVT